MTTYRIAVVAGDGIGPEVTAEGLKVLRAAGDRFGFGIETTDYPWSGKHYVDTGELMPDSALAEYADHDAVFLGAIGYPGVEPGLVERNVVAGIRFGMDLYVNLRPVKLYDARLCPLKDATPETVDIQVVRENTEDLYVGTHGFFKKGTPDEVATQELLLTRKGTERVLRYAFELAARRPGRKLTVVDKANAVRAYDLWRRTAAELAPEFADVALDFLYVDVAAMLLVSDPGRFDTLVAPNLFGDILTDLGAALQGGMGAAASANLHPGRTGMFEPVHGSAPDIAGTGRANPVAAVASIGLMLDVLGQPEAAAAVEAAISDALVSGRLPGLGADTGLTTAAIGDLLAAGVRG